MLLELERIQSVAAGIMAMKIALPFMLPKQAELRISGKGRRIQKPVGTA